MTAYPATVHGGAQLAPALSCVTAGQPAALAGLRAAFVIADAGTLAGAALPALALRSRPAPAR